jgi:cyclophilin family peptidyl-prolyl cis-trans isomerase
MIQGGDPESKKAGKGQRLGGGGPSYTIPSEIVNGNVHIYGALAAARQGDDVNPLKASSGSQFYIVHGKPVSENQIEILEQQKGYKLTPEQKKTMMEKGGTPLLDREYTVFGQVIDGLNIIDKIAATQTDGSDRPVEDVKIIKIKIIK